jgi:membrane associated rhomboid family serine protease
MMRLRPPALSALVSFLLGAGWGIALIGALGMFASFLQVSNFFIAIFAALLGTIPGLVLVVLMEYILLKSETLEQLKRQTQLLETISSSS